MQYAEDDGADDGPQSRTAFREAEKKYQLFRERKIKMKKGKPKAGKLITRPIDMSDVLDLCATAHNPPPPGVVRHEVPGYAGPVYTFNRHPGLVYLPGALPVEQQVELTTAALMDYPEPPARTNHTMFYGLLPGLWRAAQQGLRLNWGRRDDPRAGASRRVGCEHTPAKPHRFPDPELASSAAANATVPTAAECVPQCVVDSGVEQAASAAVEPELTDAHPSGTHGRPGCRCGLQGQGGANSSGTRCREAEAGTSGSSLNGGLVVTTGTMLAMEPPSAEEQKRDTDMGSCRSSGPSVECPGRCSGADGGCDLGLSRAAAAMKAPSGDCGGQRGRSGGARSSDGGSDRRRSSSSGSSGHRSSGSGSDCCCGASAEMAPEFDECWSAEGSGPPAEQLLRKLRWATLGPQFDWTQRQYDFTGVYRQLPRSLEVLARQMAAVVDSLQLAGLGVLPARAAAEGYKPDAAIINYYQQGDVLGGHLDDVERDMAQPIVSVSLGCPAIFLMGGPTKDVAPSAILLRGGDVLLLAGEARTCYHGVPRILEAQQWDDPRAAGRPPGPMDQYTRCARINVSIRAVV